MNKTGKQLSNRRGIYGGFLNLRQNGTIKEIQEWIKYYEKQKDFCPKRKEKILEHFNKLLDKKEDNGKM